MQAQNTLNYAVRLQQNKHALFVLFSFALVQTPRGNNTVTQRIAHAVVTLQGNATSADVRKVVLAQQKLDNAEYTRGYLNDAAYKLLRKNDSNNL